MQFWGTYQGRAAGIPAPSRRSCGTGSIIPEQTTRKPQDGAMPSPFGIMEMALEIVLVIKMTSDEYLAL